MSPQKTRAFAAQMITELRETLELALDSLEYIERAHPEVSGKWGRANAIEKARAAIAKAKGEA